MHVNPTGSTLGATVTGVDLGVISGPDTNDELRASMTQALHTHQVLVFPNQKLRPDHLLNFAQYFGAVSRYPFAADLPGFPGVTEVIKREDEQLNFGGVWHSDTTYTANPPIASLLYSREVPPQGGDTLFVDTYAVWDSLSDGLKSVLCEQRGVNTSALRSAAGSNIRGAFGKSMAVRHTDEADLTAVHPVARVHPDTAKTALYVNSAHTKQFLDMTMVESKPLLDYLFKQIQQPEFCYRHIWQPDMIVIWDNRCTQHYAVNDYHGHRRVMQRVTIEAD